MMWNWVHSWTGKGQLQRSLWNGPSRAQKREESNSKNFHLLFCNSVRTEKTKYSVPCHFNFRFYFIHLSAGFLFFFLWVLGWSVGGFYFHSPFSYQLTAKCLSPRTGPMTDYSCPVMNRLSYRRCITALFPYLSTSLSPQTSSTADCTVNPGPPGAPVHHLSLPTPALRWLVHLLPSVLLSY